MSHNSHCRNESLTLVINSKSCLTVQWVIKFSLSSIFSFNTEVILRATLNSTCLQLTCISLRIPFLFHLTLLQPLSKVTFLLQMMKLWAFTSFECSHSNDTRLFQVNSPLQCYGHRFLSCSLDLERCQDWWDQIQAPLPLVCSEDFIFQQLLAHTVIEFHSLSIWIS